MRLTYTVRGPLGATIEDTVVEQFDLQEGSEIDLRVEDDRIVIERIRPKILAPVSDVAARAERQKRIAAAMDEVMSEHDELFALLAK